MNTTTKTIVFWLALLVTVTLSYGMLPHRTLQAITTPPSAAKKVDYSIVALEPSSGDLRAVLETRGNEGWELAAPVVNNGTTTALIFKREKK
jgi:hypothetical protein